MMYCSCLQVEIITKKLIYQNLTSPLRSISACECCDGHCHRDCNGYCNGEEGASGLSTGFFSQKQATEVDM